MLESSDDRLSALLLEKKLVSLDQISECLGIQQKMREMGIVPKGLREILVEKGFLNATQLEALSRDSAPAVTLAAPAAAPPADPPPKTTQGNVIQIPGYAILSKIGQGGMGSVFKGRQVSMDRLVAIKILPPRFAKDPMFVDRFQREAKASAKLNHENVIQGIDVGEVKGIHYFVMEYVEGEPVSTRLKKEGRVPEAEALEIGLQMTKALDHAHKNQLVHRDVKPENVMVTREGVAKLCDLGLAKDIRSDSSLTQAGTSVGTPHYIAPEQARGEKDVDIRADVYGLGASLYHMLVGEVPFDGPTATVVMTKHVTEDLVPPIRRNPAISPGANAIVVKAMAKMREHRYQTPHEMQEDLEAVLRGDAPIHAKLRGGRSSSGATSKTTPSSASLRAVRPVRHAAPRSSALTTVVIGVGIAGAALVGFLLAGKDPRGGQAENPPTNHPVVANRPLPVNTTPPANTAPVVPGGADLKRAEADLEKIVAFEEQCLKDLKDLDEVRLRYADFLITHKGSEVVRKAEILRNRFEEAVQIRAEEWVTGAEAKIRASLDGGRYSEALAVEVEIPRAFHKTHAVGRLRETLERARVAQDQAYRDALAECDAKLDKGDYAGATAALQRVTDFGTALMVKTALEKTAEVDAKRRAYEAGLTRAAEMAFTEKFEPELAAILSSRKLTRYPEALARCEELLAGELKPIADKVKGGIWIDAALLAALRDDVFSGIGEVQKRGVAVKLEGINNKMPIKFTLSQTAGAWDYSFAASGGGEVRAALNLDRLTVNDILLLANEAPAFKTGGPDSSMKLGLLEHYGGSADARKWFEKSVRDYGEAGLPVRAARAKTFLDQLDAAAAGVSAKEKEARDRYARGEAAFKAKEWENARSLLQDLIDPNHPEGWASMTWVKEHTPQIREMLKTIERELSAAGGPVKPSTGGFAVEGRAEGGRTVWEYEFKNEAEFDDWTIGGGTWFGSIPKWYRQPRSGRPILEDGGIVWKGQLTGDLIVEIDFAPHPAAPLKNFFVLYHAQAVGGQDARQHKGYLAGLANEKDYLRGLLSAWPNIVNTIENIKPDRIIRIDIQRAIQTRSPSEGFEAIRQESILGTVLGGRSHRVRVEKSGKHHAVHYGNRVLLRGDNDDLTTGQLFIGFYESKASITRIKITGTLDPAWSANPGGGR